MSSAVLLSSTAVVDDGAVSGSSPRSGGPSRRRSFTPAEKRGHVIAYEAACEKSEGGAYLRREGLYSSLMFEWRRLRDAGLLEGKQAGATIGRPSAEQTEIVRLRRQLDQAQRRLATTETALEIMGKAHAYVGDRCQAGLSSSRLSRVS